MKLRQCEVDMLQRLADGDNVKQIAKDRGRDYMAFKTEKARTIHKLGSDNIVKAVVRAFSFGLIK